MMLREHHVGALRLLLDSTMGVARTSVASVMQHSFGKTSTVITLVLVGRLAFGGSEVKPVDFGVSK